LLLPLFLLVVLILCDQETEISSLTMSSKQYPNTVEKILQRI
jgi:hypothetical protein